MVKMLHSILCFINHNFFLSGRERVQIRVMPSKDPTGPTGSEDGSTGTDRPGLVSETRWGPVDTEWKS